MTGRKDLAEKVRRHGLYRDYSFTEFDGELRKRGWYAEEILMEDSVPSALRRIARDFDKTDWEDGFMMIPATEVLVGEFTNRDYVFYRPISRVFPNG